MKPIRITSAHQSITFSRRMLLLGTAQAGIGGLLIGRVKPDQATPAIDLVQHPTFHPFGFGCGREHDFEECRRDDDCSILVNDNDVARQDGDAAAADGLLPADKGQASH